MTAFLRDAAATGAIFGFFASAWFGWAQEAPPPRWRPLMITGSVLSLLCLVAGGLLAWRHWDDGTVFDAHTSPRFGIVVGIEFAAVGLGAAILAWRKRKELIAPWAALVVGVHFFPLAAILRYPMLNAVAVLVTVIAVRSPSFARRRSVTVSAVTGLGVGVVLLAAAFTSLVWALTAF